VKQKERIYSGKKFS